MSKNLVRGIYVVGGLASLSMAAISTYQKIQNDISIANGLIFFCPNFLAFLSLMKILWGKNDPIRESNNKYKYYISASTLLLTAFTFFEGFKIQNSEVLVNDTDLVAMYLNSVSLFFLELTRLSFFPPIRLKSSYTLAQFEELEKKNCCYVLSNFITGFLLFATFIIGIVSGLMKYGENIPNPSLTAETSFCFNSFNVLSVVMPLCYNKGSGCFSNSDFYRTLSLFIFSIVDIALPNGLPRVAMIFSNFVNIGIATWHSALRKKEGGEVEGTKLLPMPART